MKCAHHTAAFLESVTRAACGVDPEGMGGLVSGQVFEKDAMLPAFLSLLPYLKGPCRNKIEEFLGKYYPLLCTAEPEAVLSEELAGSYPYELSALVYEILEAERRK